MKHIFVGSILALMASASAAFAEKESFDGTVSSVDAAAGTVVVAQKVADGAQDVPVTVRDASALSQTKTGDRVRVNDVEEKDGKLHAESVQLLTPETSDAQSTR